MEYFISFLEGLITFISPCLLPLLPVFISYFAGENLQTVQGGSTFVGENSEPTGRGVAGGATKTIWGVLGFIMGFTLIFVALGAFAGLLGGFLSRYQTGVNITAGAIVIFFGLSYLGIFKINLFRGALGARQSPTPGFFSALLFGMIFSISWTPCVGVFLGSALMLASQQGSAVRGVLMLLCYSLGLGVPFLLSALLIERLKTAFVWIKMRYRIVSAVSGLFLVAVGILMMTGYMNRYLSLLTF